jgi:hypothetical protein
MLFIDKIVSMNGPVTRFASCRGSLGAGLHCPAPHMGEDAVLPEAGGGPCLIAGMCQPGKAPGLPSIMSGQVGHAVRVELCDPARMLHRRSGAVPASSAPATRCHAGYGAWHVAVFCSQHRPGRQSRPAALFSDRDHRQAYAVLITTDSLTVGLAGERRDQQRPFRTSRE